MPEEGSGAALRKRKYGEGQSVPPIARRQLAESSEEIVKKVVREESARSKTKQPVPKARFLTCVSPLQIF